MEDSTAALAAAVVGQQEQPDDVDPVMAYVEKLEAWRQGKLDQFDADEEYRDARLMKHGTRTGFEEFLDRSIERKVKESITRMAQQQKKKEKKKKKKAKNSSGNGRVGDAIDDVATAVKSLTAFEKMAAALRKGVLGTESTGQQQQHEGCLLYTSPSPRDRG